MGHNPTFFNDWWEICNQNEGVYSINLQYLSRPCWLFLFHIYAYLLLRIWPNELFTLYSLVFEVCCFEVLLIFYRSGGKYWLIAESFNIYSYRTELSIHWRQDEMFPFCNVTDYIFKCAYFYEKLIVFTQIVPLCIRKGTVNNRLALVQKIIWRGTGDKPLSEPMMN